jgi:formylmethanofuran dehydrogenase subunit E
MNEETILVCCRIADHPIPSTKSMVNQCWWCGQNVWRAYSSPRTGRVICERCFARKRQDGDIIEPPTADQLRDIFRKPFRE